MKTAFIDHYLQELGPEAYSLQNSGLASLCQFILQGKLSNDLKNKCINTVIWQETQMMLSKTIIDALHKNNIKYPLDYSLASDLDLDCSFLEVLHGKFRRVEEFVDMQSGPESRGVFRFSISGLRHGW